MMNNKKKLKIGIVGCGAIGSTLARLIRKRYSNSISVRAVCDIDKTKADILVKKINTAKAVSLPELIGLCDLVIEAASAGVSFEVAREALKNKKQVLVMSVGGVLGKEKKLFDLAEKNNTKIFFPSGAICGLDGIRALSLSRIKSITLTTTKPVSGLQGARYLIEHGIDLKGITKEMIVFEGGARKAVKAFPQNINVVAVLSLAAEGAVEPKVKIVASPFVTKNIHKIEVDSDAARLEIKCENIPSPDNPKTSYLAILSALTVIAGILKQERIGN